MLDEAGATVQVIAVPPDRFAAAVTAGAWDLRVAQIIAPTPDPIAVLAAALAAIGQIDSARALAHPRALFDPQLAAAAAARFPIPALLLGRRREVIHHRADLRNLAFDALGRANLADLSLERGPDGEPPR
jgi:hypothetical protein